MNIGIVCVTRQEFIYLFILWLKVKNLSLNSMSYFMIIKQVIESVKKFYTTI